MSVVVSVRLKFSYFLIPNFINSHNKLSSLLINVPRSSPRSYSTSLS
nr:MAG TPA: hypothetical protein [Caudoviricetes sp.]